MIISASYKTDIPAFYGDWFQRRLDAGICHLVNPYSGRSHEVPLTRDSVDGFVFWTRNAAPFLESLAMVAKRGFPFAVHYTVTGYPRPLETSVTLPEQSIGVMRRLAKLYGARTVVWRYDPVILTSLTPPAWHRRNFAKLAAALAGTVDEVVLSFAQIYAKTQRNMDQAAAKHGFQWTDPSIEEKRDLLTGLAAIAAEQGLQVSLCAQPALVNAGQGLAPARCIDATRLSDIAGTTIAATTKGNRDGCFCAESRDIGAYDSCPHGCAYCYAVRKPALAKQRYRHHDAAAMNLA